MALVAASSAACQIFTIVLAGIPVFYSYKPHGNCVNCCPINEREDIRFLLYTRENPDRPYQLYIDDDYQLQSSTFRFDRPLAIFIHGFQESPTIPNRSGQEIKNGFLRYGDYNVVLVDWSSLVPTPWYISAVNNAPVAGRYIAGFLRYLIQRGFSPQQIHLLGFSLGGQAVGYVGREMKKWGLTLPRITGIDPAYPLYIDGTNQRLGPEDADFVDVIHTDGGVEGHPAALGHVDFYPNGGRPLQPGCVQQSSTENRLSSFVLLTGICSHNRAWQYFVESLNQPQAFPTTTCKPTRKFPICRAINGVAYMGIKANPQLRGRFYLETNGASPFGRNLNHPLRRLKSNPGAVRSEKETNFEVSSPEFPKLFFSMIGPYKP